MHRFRIRKAVSYSHGTITGSQGRIPDSCAGCHNSPDVGGGGDIVGNIFVLGQRFDFATFNLNDTIPKKALWMSEACP